MKKETGKTKRATVPLVYFHLCKLFTRLLQKKMERALDENQPREQAGFRKGYSTTDHLQSVNQIIEKKQ